MELNGRRLADGTTLSTDVCIVGAGPAGLVLAREFIGSSCDVLLLDSGGLRFDRRIQALNDGPVVGDQYLGQRHTRQRQVGGTTQMWNTPVGNADGAKYVPLDPWDFSQQRDLPLSGWPFDFAHLEPYYRRAQQICGLGPFRYRGEHWCDRETTSLQLDEPNLVTGVYQYGQGAQFTETYVREVIESHNVRLCHSATVVRLLTAGNGRRVVGLSALSRAGTSLRVEARLVVLAGGAIENARLLLLARDSGSSRVSDPAGWTGRCFMEHPRDFAMTLFPRSRDFFREAAFYAPHRAQDGTVICGRIALTEQAIGRARLPNASITLLLGSKPRLPPRGAAGRLVQRLHRAGRRQAGGFSGHLIGHLRTLAGRASDAGYGWPRIGRPSQRLRASRLLVNLEQRPHVDNRIVLGTSRDFLGVPRAVLHWRWRAEEQAELERLRTAVAGWFGAANLGRVEIGTGVAPDPNAHHHAGTTRMHVDPGRGVVDADGRVHGTDNLYVTGASVFPTSGFANPTLTITALSLRLADCLKQRN